MRKYDIGLIHFTVCASIFMLSGCGTTLKYYKTANTNVLKPAVGLDIFSQPVPAGSQTVSRLSNLTAEGQAEFIKKHTGSPANLASDLARIIRRSADVSGVRTDRSRIETRRRLNMTVFSEQFKPSDRLVEAKVVLTPPLGWSFTAWDGATVERNTTRLATIVDQLNSSTTTTLPLGLGSVPIVGGSAQASNTLARNEQVTQNIDVEVVEFLPSITTEKAFLRLYAPFPQSNVAGSYAVNLTLEAKDKFSTHVHSFNNNNAEASIGLTRTFFRGALNQNSSNDINFQAELSYVKRQVSADTNKYARSVKESDDKVEYILSETKPNPVDKLKAKAEIDNIEQGLIVWSVDYTNKNNIDKPLRITVTKHNETTLPTIDKTCAFFTSNQQAREFSTWLKKQSTNRNGKIVYSKTKNDFSIEAQKGEVLSSSFNINQRKILNLTSISTAFGTIIRPSTPELKTCPVTREL